MALDVCRSFSSLFTALAVACPVSVSGRLDVNVALNRSSYQAGVHSNQQVMFYPQYANDGNLNTDVYLGPCAHTLWHTNPWWAVDLGTALYVTGVKFTNLLNQWAYRSDNFIIGLTNVSPTVTAPTLWNYAVCGQYPGAVAGGMTVSLQCASDLTTQYRYVIVQFPTTNEPGNFCELEVYIRRWEWACRPGQKMINRDVSTFQVDVRLQCMTNCTLSPVCDSYNYRPSDNTCQLNTHSTPLIAISSDLVIDNAWNWWSPTFTTIQ